MFSITNISEQNIVFETPNYKIELIKNTKILLDNDKYNELMKNYGCFIEERINKYFLIESSKENQVDIEIEEINTAEENFNKKTLKELKEIAIEKNIDFVKNIKKTELIKLLEENENNSR